MPAAPHLQKLAVMRAHQILEEIYPARIGGKKATKEEAAAHLAALLDACEELDRRDLNSKPLK